MIHGIWATPRCPFRGRSEALSLFQIGWWIRQVPFYHTSRKCPRNERGARSVLRIGKINVCRADWDDAHGHSLPAPRRKTRIAHPVESALISIRDTSRWIKHGFKTSRTNGCGPCGVCGCITTSAVVPRWRARVAWRRSVVTQSRRSTNGQNRVTRRWRCRRRPNHPRRVDHVRQQSSNPDQRDGASRNGSWRGSGRRRIGKNRLGIAFPKGLQLRSSGAVTPSEGINGEGSERRS